MITNHGTIWDMLQFMMRIFILWQGWESVGTINVLVSGKKPEVYTRLTPATTRPSSPGPTEPKTASTPPNPNGSEEILSKMPPAAATSKSDRRLIMGEQEFNIDVVLLIHLRKPQQKE